MVPNEQLLGGRGTALGAETLDETVIRSLASYRSGRPMTSMYLDVDGRRRPSAEDIENAASHLYRRARRAAEQFGTEAVAGVEADLAGIADRLAEGVDRRTVRGLAMFSYAAEGILRVIELPVAVRDRVTVGNRPDVTPLVETLDRARRYLLVLVDRQDSRLVQARLGRIEAQPGPTDPVERQVDTDVEKGSWERRHQEAALRHLRRVAAAVSHAVETNPVDAVILGGSQEAIDGLTALLPPAVAGLVVVRPGLPVKAGRADLLKAIDQVDASQEEGHQAAVLDVLSDRIGTGRGAAGLEATLEALSDGRVATLVVKPGLTNPGARCPGCGHLGTGSRPCPRCGSATEPVEDVVEAAIDRALLQDAAVEFCPAAGLEEFGGIGAVERY